MVPKQHSNPIYTLLLTVILLLGSGHTFPFPTATQWLLTVYKRNPQTHRFSSWPSFLFPIFHPATGFSQAFLIPILLFLQHALNFLKYFRLLLLSPPPTIYNCLPFPYLVGWSSSYQSKLIANLSSSVTPRSFQPSHIFTMYFSSNDHWMYFSNGVAVCILRLWSSNGQGPWLADIWDLMALNTTCYSLVNVNRYLFN